MLYTGKQEQPSSDSVLQQINGVACRKRHPLSSCHRARLYKAPSHQAVDSASTNHGHLRHVRRAIIRHVRRVVIPHVRRTIVRHVCRVDMTEGLQDRYLSSVLACTSDDAQHMCVRQQTRSSFNTSPSRRSTTAAKERLVHAKVKPCKQSPTQQACSSNRQALQATRLLKASPSTTHQVTAAFTRSWKGEAPPPFRKDPLPPTERKPCPRETDIETR
jgi:hypothetical protein